MKYKICVDLCRSGNRENKPLFESGLFHNENEAIEWAKTICTQYAPLDIVLCECSENGEMTGETTLLSH